MPYDYDLFDDDDHHIEEYEYNDPSREATYHGEELTVVFQGRLEVSDYGVPMSPKLYSIEDIKIVQLEILGITIDINALPELLQEKIQALNEEVEWDI